MNTGKIYFISRPSPTLGRPALFKSGVFGLYRERHYINALQKRLATEGLAWTVVADDTESDIEKLIEQKADLIICAPGLRLQFYTNGFNKDDIIYLSMMDYMNNNTRIIIHKIREREKPKRAFQ